MRGRGRWGRARAPRRGRRRSSSQACARRCARPPRGGDASPATSLPGSTSAASVFSQMPPRYVGEATSACTASRSKTSYSWPKRSSSSALSSIQGSSCSSSATPRSPVSSRSQSMPSRSMSAMKPWKFSRPSRSSWGISSAKRARPFSIPCVSGRARSHRCARSHRSRRCPPRARRRRVRGRRPWRAAPPRAL